MGTIFLFSPQKEKKNGYTFCSNTKHSVQTKAMSNRCIKYIYMVTVLLVNPKKNKITPVS